MNGIFWSSWSSVANAAIVALCAYVALLVFLRTSGKRSTGKFNMFDWVVTVALGSMLASTILSDEIPLASGLVGFASLLGLQFVFSWLSVRSPLFRNLIKAEPKLLFHGGRFLDRNMRAERITEEEVRAAARESGIGSLRDVAAVVLETNAELSVIGKTPDGRAGTLEGIHVPEGDVKTSKPA